jgi:uncharacterized membrane protein (UPF0127 family)
VASAGRPLRAPSTAERRSAMIFSESRPKAHCTWMLALPFIVLDVT